MLNNYLGSVILQPEHHGTRKQYAQEVHKRITRARELIALVKKSYSKITVLMIRPGVRTLLIKGDN